MTLSGHVNTLPLADLIQSAASARRSCRIHVAGRLAQGDLYLQTGEVIHGRYGDLVGVDAVYSMLADPDAWFTVAPLDPREPVPHTIAIPWRQLIMEGVKRLDEGTLRRPTPLISAAQAITPPPRPLDGARRRRWLSPRVQNSLIALGGIGALLLSAALTTRLLAPKKPARTEAPAPPPPAPLAASPLGLDAGVVDVELPPRDREPRLVDGSLPPTPVPSVGFTPTILLRLKVGPTGAVEDARPDARRPDLGVFEEAALRAARAFRFAPAIRGGQPVTAWITYPLTFLPGSASFSGRKALTVKGAEVLGAGLGPALAKAYESDHPGVTIRWEKLTSKAGIAALLDGTADLAASTRPLSAAEIGDARRIGVALTEVVLGQDAMTVVVHPDNPAAAVPLDALPGLFRGEIADWSDLTARRRGAGPNRRAAPAAASRPVLPLVGRVYADDRQAVDELVGGAATDPDGRRFAPGTRYYEAAEEIIAAVATAPGAFGLTSRVLVTEKVRALPLLVAGERRVPSPAAIQDGSYPLRRPIYLISLSPPPGAAGDFLRFAVSPRGRGIVERWGFVPPADGDAAAAGLGGCASCAPARPQVFRITFSRQATAVPEAAKRRLARLAGAVARTGQRLLVIGHSDPRDGLREAVRDSRERARNVLQFLEENELPPSQVEVRIAGAEAPIDTNRTSRGRRRNRRVDVFVIQPGN